MKHVIIGDLHGRDVWRRVDFYPKYFCPGFRAAMQPELTRLFRSNRELFQIACQRRNVIFTHAGITNTWYRRFNDSAIVDKVCSINKDSLADVINKVELTDRRDILYTPSPYRTGVQIIWKLSRTRSTATNSLSANPARFFTNKPISMNSTANPT